MKIPEGLVWLDGALVPSDRATVALTDPAIQSGVGVFETLAVREGLLLDWEAHFERLKTAAGRLGVPLPRADTLAQASATVAARVEGGLGWLKIMAVRGNHCVVFSGVMEASEEGRSVSAVLLPWRRNPKDPLTSLKTLNYAALTLGLEEARRRGADEGIWLNTRGHLAEACTSNVLVVCKRKIFTPGPREGILPGVTRSFALRAAHELGLNVHEGKVRLSRLETGDEAFLTSSLRGVRPLVIFQGRPVGRGEPGPITRAIAREVAALRRPWKPATAARSAGRGQGEGAEARLLQEEK